MLVRLRDNADIVRDCFEWAREFHKARTQSPAFDLAWRSLQACSGSKFLRFVEGLGFFDVSFCYGGAIGFMLEGEWKDGRSQPRYQQGGSCWAGVEYSFYFESGTETGGRERIEYRRIKSFQPKPMGDAKTRTWVRNFRERGKVTELECFETKVNFEVMAEDWQVLTRKVGAKEAVLWSSGRPGPVRHWATLTLGYTPMGDWYYVKLIIDGREVGPGWQKAAATAGNGEREAWLHLTELDEEYWIQWTRPFVSPPGFESRRISE